MVDLISATVFHRSGAVSTNLYLQLSPAGLPVALFRKDPDGTFQRAAAFKEVSAIYTRSMRYARHWDGSWMMFPYERRANDADRGQG
jgi:hypothetical protein